MSSRAWWPPIQAQTRPSSPDQLHKPAQHGTPRTYMPADNLAWTSTSITFDIRGAAQPSQQCVPTARSPIKQADQATPRKTSSLHSQTSNNTIDPTETASGAQTQCSPTALSCHPGQLLSRLAQVAPPEWLWQKHNLASLNLHLSPRSSELLQRCLRQRQPVSVPSGQQRCMLLQQPTVPQLLSMPLGTLVQMQAVAYVRNSR